MTWIPLSAAPSRVEKVSAPSIFSEKTLGTGDTAWLMDALDAGALSASGVRVSPKTALGDPRVLVCVQAIAQDIAKVPLNFYTVKGDTRRVARNSPLHRTVSKRPNSFQSPYEWKEYIAFSLLLDGNSYCYMSIDGRGVLQEAIPINPVRVQLYEAPDGSIFYNVSVGSSFERSKISHEGGVMIPAERIWHLRNLPYGSGLLGASPISLCRDAVGQSLSLQAQASGMSKTGAKLSGVLRHPKKMKPGLRDRLRAQWRDSYEGSNKTGKTAILEEGMEFQPISMKAVDAQFIEQMQFSVLDICRIFRVPPSKAMDNSHTTYNNQEQENLAYVTDTLMPYYERWESSMNAFVIPESQGANHYFEFDISRLTRGDEKSRAKKRASEIQWGVSSANEFRKEDGKSPYEGGDTFVRPANMVAVPGQPNLDDAEIMPGGNIGGGPPDASGDGSGQPENGDSGESDGSGQSDPV